MSESLRRLQRRGDAAERRQGAERARIRRWIVTAALARGREGAGGDIARERDGDVRQRERGELVAGRRRVERLPWQRRGEDDCSEDAGENPHTRLLL